MQRALNDLDYEDEEEDDTEEAEDNMKFIDVPSNY